jgi:SAM-dependent methyltransferase
MQGHSKGLLDLPRYVVDHYRGSGPRGPFSLAKALFINRILFRHFPSAITGKNRVMCPCCGWQGRYFLPYIGKGHVKFNQYCPTCESHARHRGHRILYEKVLDCKAWKGKLLYFSPEPCILQYFRSNLSSIQIETADYSAEGVDHRVDILDIPFRDESYDFILCHHVIEHVPDDFRAIRELKRILRTGGEAILSVPMDTNRGFTIEWGRPNPLFDDHYYDYGMDFRERLSKAFPTVEEFAFSKIFTDEQRRQHGIDDSIVYVCRR